jgi:chromosome segregation ATPase
MSDPIKHEETTERSIPPMPPLANETELNDRLFEVKFENLKETVKELINKTDENTRSIFKFDSVNKEIVNLRISIETKFKSVNKEIVNLKESMETKFESVDNKFESVNNKFESVNKDILKLNSSLDSMKNFIIGGIVTIVAAVAAGIVLNIIF